MSWLNNTLVRLIERSSVQVYSLPEIAIIIGEQLSFVSVRFPTSWKLEHDTTMALVKTFIPGSLVFR
jgi:hypothetical protein